MSLAFSYDEAGRFAKPLNNNLRSTEVSPDLPLPLLRRGIPHRIEEPLLYLNLSVI